MKVWNSFPVLRLMLPFLAGVVSWAFILERITVSPDHLIYGPPVVALAIVLTIVLSIHPRKTHRFGLALWPSLYLLGAMLTVSCADHLFPDHMMKRQVGKSNRSYLAVIVDQPVVKENSIKIVAKVSDLELESHGQVLLYFKRDSLSSELKYGEELLLRTTLETVDGLGNPNEFNYGRYLRFHNILVRGYVKSGDWQRLSNGQPGLTGWLLDVRAELIDRFEAAGVDGNELAVASALILGYRAELDRDLMTAYAGAGATHVLAVSGLHVGIVYVILNMLLKFLDRNRSGRILKTVLLVGLLFGYAALTGLSASVARAATMFAFVAIGKAINRNTNIFNTLAASAFCLILFDPMIIMQVGFQLSYLAVFGIVVIQSRLFNLITVENRFLDWAWSITCVSIAAQIATFPLGLLYFHQFPNLFLLSNLLVIPAAAVILYLGFLLFVFSFWQPTLLFFGFLLKTVISTLNHVVVLIERIPYSVLSGIDISTTESLMIYAMILSFLVFIAQQKRMALYGALCLAVVFMGMQIREVHEHRHQRFITAYNVKGETALALVNGTEVTFICSRQLWKNEQAMLFHVRHHWWNKGIDKEHFVELNDSIYNRRLEWGENSFAILHADDASAKVGMDGNELDLLVVERVKWNSVAELGILQPKHILAPNTMGRKTLDRIAGITDAKFMTVADQGAVTIDLKH